MICEQYFIEGNKPRGLGMERILTKGSWNPGHPGQKLLHGVVKEWAKEMGRNTKGEGVCIWTCGMIGKSSHSTCSPLISTLFYLF